MSETFSTLDETPAEEPVPTETIPRSPYELVVVAAQEARRLNERWRRSSNDHTEKVTKIAVDRVLAGQVHFLHNENP
jgi:hypothetical protein